MKKREPNLEQKCNYVIFKNSTINNFVIENNIVSNLNVNLRCESISNLEKIFHHLKNINEFNKKAIAFAIANVYEPCTINKQIKQMFEFFQVY